MYYYSVGDSVFVEKSREVRVLWLRFEAVGGPGSGTGAVFLSGGSGIRLAVGSGKRGKSAV